MEWSINRADNTNPDSFKQLNTSQARLDTEIADHLRFKRNCFQSVSVHRKPNTALDW